MELLRQAPRTPDLPARVALLLRDEVWARPEVPDDGQWFNRFESLGAPPCIRFVERLCLTHGDPTLANTMMRSGGELVLCDPLPPRRRVPQCAVVDAGKILQSMLGWEVILSGVETVAWEAPDFFGDQDFLRKATYWCGVHLLRAHSHELEQENRLYIVCWLDSMAKELFHAAGI